MLTRLILRTFAAALVLLAPHSYAASTVWTDWLSFTPGEPGSATGMLGDVTVSYSGEVLGNSVVNGGTDIWNPEASFLGGVVDTSPDGVGDAITLNGSSITTTITFSAPITNPVMAIWSLGQPGLSASLTFEQTPTFVVGGPNDDFIGGPISVNGNTVSGNEGNGVIVFFGEYTSLSFTNTPENFYAITVGATPVPLPAGVWLLGSALLGVFGVSRRRRG